MTTTKVIEVDTERPLLLPLPLPRPRPRRRRLGLNNEGCDAWDALFQCCPRALEGG